MFRTALITLALVLALGQNTDLLCAAWCEAATPDKAGCGHEQGSTSSSVMSAGDHCTERPVTGTFIPESGRRGPSAVERLSATTLFAFQVSQSVSSLASLRPREQPTAPSIRSLSSPLRI